MNKKEPGKFPAYFAFGIISAVLMTAIYCISAFFYSPNSSINVTTIVMLLVNYAFLFTPVVITAWLIGYMNDIQQFSCNLQKSAQTENPLSYGNDFKTHKSRWYPVVTVISLSISAVIWDTLIFVTAFITALIGAIKFYHFFNDYKHLQESLKYLPKKENKE